MTKITKKLKNYNKLIEKDKILKSKKNTVNKNKKTNKKPKTIRKNKINKILKKQTGGNKILEDLLLDNKLPEDADALVIDVDTILTDFFFNKCANLIYNVKGVCVGVIKQESKFRDYFKDYDFLISLLKELRSRTPNPPYVFFTSNKIYRTNLKALLSRDDITEILANIIRVNETQDGNFVYLEKYLIVPDNLTNFPESKTPEPPEPRETPENFVKIILEKIDKQIKEMSDYSSTGISTKSPLKVYFVTKSNLKEEIVNDTGSIKLNPIIVDTLSEEQKSIIETALQQALNHSLKRDYMAFRELFPEAPLSQSGFDILKPNPGYISILDMFDKFIFDFDNTITRGCISSKRFPLRNFDNNSISSGELTHAYFESMERKISQLQERKEEDYKKKIRQIREQFVDDLYGLENGHFFAKLIRYLRNHGKKYAIVTFGVTGIINKCLEILFSVMHEKYSGIGKEGFNLKDATFFYNPFDKYRNYTQSLYPRPLPNTTNIGEKTFFSPMTNIHVMHWWNKTHIGIPLKYESGVILSPNPYELVESLKGDSLKTPQNEIDNNAKISLLNNDYLSEMRDYRKNKLLLRIIADFSDFNTENGVFSIDSPENEKINNAFRSSIFFDDDANNIVSLKNRQKTSVEGDINSSTLKNFNREYENREYSNREFLVNEKFLALVSGIIVGYFKSEQSKDINSTICSTTGKKGNVGLSLGAFIRINEYLNNGFKKTKQGQKTIIEPIKNLSGKGIGRIPLPETILFNRSSI